MYSGAKYPKVPTTLNGFVLAEFCFDGWFTIAAPKSES
jgi:hypothetical protein